MRGALAIILGMCVETTLHAYAIFNRSSDPTEIISTLVFKNERSAYEFFNQLGWTQRVSDVTDKAGAAAGIATLVNPLLLPIGLAGGIAVGTTKIAEAAIIAKYLWHGQNTELLITPTAKATYYTDLGDSDDVIDQKLTFRTGSAWWWKAIEAQHGSDGYNPFVVIVHIPEVSSGLPSFNELFRMAQQTKYMNMEVVSSSHINRAAIVDYKGNNKLITYLPFVAQKYSSQINKDSIPAKDIQWLTVAQGKQKNLLLYKYMTGSTLTEIEDLLTVNEIRTDKKFDQGLSLLFKNNSDHSVHAFFISQKDLAAILKAGGWTQKTAEQLMTICKTVSGIAVDAATGLPVSALTNVAFSAIEAIIGDLLQQAGTGIAIAAIKPKDYFINVSPGILRYSYYANSSAGQGFSRPLSAIESGFSKVKTYGANMVIAIFPNDEKKQPDLTKPEFVGNFDTREYNGVIFWPKPGQIDYIKYDTSGTVAKITKTAVAFGVPVELSGDDVQITSTGETILKQEIIEATSLATTATAQAHITAAKKLLSSTSK